MTARAPLQQPRPFGAIPGQALEGSPSIWHPRGYPEPPHKRQPSQRTRTTSAFDHSSQASSRPASIFSQEIPNSPTTNNTSYPSSIKGTAAPVQNGIGTLGSPQGPTFTPVSRLEAKKRKLPLWKRIKSAFSTKPEKYKQHEFVPKPESAPAEDIVPIPKAPTTSYGVKWRINSKTPKEFLPKTWEEYNEAYNKQLIDIDDPPEPPSDTLAIQMSEKSGAETSPVAEQTPFSKGDYSAPLGYYERSRQLVVDRLDCFARNTPKRTYDDLPDAIPYPANIHVSPEEYEVPVHEFELITTNHEEFKEVTLEGHPAFKKLVTYARQTFHMAMSMLSVVDNDQVKFLAETGLSMDSVPRSINFCSHTVLSSAHGFVIPDTQKDWRFKNNPLVTEHGARFYAGVPLYAPNYLNDGDEEVAIGTLCIVDTEPRTEFSLDDRKKLQRLAELARKEVASWHQSRIQIKTKAMNEGLSSFHQRATSARRAAPLPTIDEPIGAERHTSTPQIFALATRVIAQTLNVPLVYLIAVNLEQNGGENPVESLDMISSYGLPDPPPVFDAVLHYKALRAPEGGLLYQNPDTSELEDNEQFAVSDHTTYASAILISVAEVKRRGYVLAAFATAPSRVFGIEDLDYLQKISAELKPFCK